MMRYFAFALLTLIAAWAPAAFAYPIHYIPFKYDDGYREITTRARSVFRRIPWRSNERSSGGGSCMEDKSC